MDRVLVRDIMTSPPVTAPPDITAIEAARLMRDRNIGSLLVQEGARPVGIVTERDLVRKVISEGVDPASVRLRELMSSPVLTIPPGMDVLEAARSMARHHVRRLPVVQGGQLVGIVAERDILEVSPDLVEVTREQGRVEAGGDPGSTFLEPCSACAGLTDGRHRSDGMVFCDDCWVEQRTHAY